MFGKPLNVVTQCRTRVFVETLEGQTFSRPGNVFQNRVNTMPKVVFTLFDRYDFVQISPACGPHTYQIMHEET